jgi:hypothetical protein
VPEGYMARVTDSLTHHEPQMNTVRVITSNATHPSYQCAHHGALIYELIRRDAHSGIAALCLGGGNGVAMAVER